MTWAPSIVSDVRAVGSVAERMRVLADQCVQCGLCLPHCPTYGVTRRESESPRGRIALMRALARAASELDSAALDTRTLDHCLACGRCEAVCPAQVQYLDLLDLARSEQAPRRSAAATASLTLRRSRWLTAALAWFAPAAAALPLPASLRNATNALRAARPWRARSAPGAVAAAAPHGTGSARLLLLGGCSGALQPDTLSDVRRLLENLGIDYVEAGPETCCGALDRHRGDALAADRATSDLAHQARRQALTRIAALDSGCARECRRTLDDATLRSTDLIETIAHTLTQRGITLDGGGPLRIAWYRPCTQDAASVAATRRLLSAVAGLEVVELRAGHGCCGAAGTYFLDQPALAGQLVDPIIAEIVASGVDRVLTANIGCRLQLQSHLLAGARPIQVQHVVSFVADLLA